MFWKWKRKKDESEEQVLRQPVAEAVPPVIDFTFPLENEAELEIVSVIVSAVMAADRPETTIKLHSVREIDLDMEAAAIIAASVCADDKPSSSFRLKRIYEEKR